MINGQFSLMNKINFIKQKIKSFIPKEIYNYIMLHKLNRLLIARLIHVIKNLYPKIKYCNICGWGGKYFFQDTRCPICFSLPRHRFLGYIISEIDIIYKKNNVLLIGADMAEILLFIIHITIITIICNNINKNKIKNINPVLVADTQPECYSPY